MPISVSDIPEDVKELLKWKWETRKFKISFPEFLALYVYAYNKAEEYGHADPETTVLQLFDQLDPDLSYDELKSEVEGLVVPVSAPEFEELEFWRKRAEELEKQMKKAVSPAVYRELKEKYEQLKKKLEEREKEIEELKKPKVSREIREKEKELEEELKHYTTTELVTSWHSLKTKPEEMTEEEWIARREAIKRELERRGVPKSKITGDFLKPVIGWKINAETIPIPPEFRIWYDPVEQRLYRDGKAITPEKVNEIIRKFLRPAKPTPRPAPAPRVTVPRVTAPSMRTKPTKPFGNIVERGKYGNYLVDVGAEVPAFRVKGYEASYREGPPDWGTVIKRYIRPVIFKIEDVTGKKITELTEEEICEWVDRLDVERYNPRGALYLKWFVKNEPDWREWV